MDGALTDSLHKLEGPLALHAFGDQVNHNVVTAADTLIDRSDALDHQIADVAGPHIGTVREAGKAHQRIELLGLCVHQHLAGKVRAEFRNTDGTGFPDNGVIVSKAQGRR